MKALIKMNESGIMADRSGIARVDSRYVAGAFEKQHKNVLQRIAQITSEESGYSKEFTELNFQPNKYKDDRGRKCTCYLMTRDGFVALAMGFTGKKADYFKEQYIRLFNEMEQHIIIMQNLREQCPMLTEALKNMTEDPSPFIYSNEMNMLNKIVLGMTAKQYRQAHGIGDKESIRPYLSPDEAELLDRLQNVDVGLVYSGLSYKERQQKLEWFAAKYREEREDSHD